MDNKFDEFLKWVFVKNWFDVWGFKGFFWKVEKSLQVLSAFFVQILV